MDFAYSWSCNGKGLRAVYDAGLFKNNFDSSILPLDIYHKTPICSFAQSDLLYSALDEDNMNNIYCVCLL